MNPEIIKIALENKEIVDKLKSQLLAYNTTAVASVNSTKKNGGIWKLALVAGIGILGYNIYNHFIKKPIVNKI